MKENIYMRIYNKSILFGIIVFAILLGITQIVAYQRYLLNKRGEKELVLEHANIVKNQLQNSLYHSLSATKTLAFIVEKYGVPNDFDSIAKALMESVKYIDAVQLVERGIIINVYPLKGNEKAIGYNILEDSTRNKEAFKAIEKKELFFAGPLKLKQGGFAVVGRQPIFRNGNFWGFSAVIIKFSTLLKAAGINILNDKFEYQFSKINPDTGEEDFFIPNFNNVNVTQTSFIQVPNGEWNLYVKLKHENGYNSILPIYVFGFLFSIMGGILTWLKLKEPEELSKKVEEKAYLLNRLEKRYRIIIENSLIPLFLGKPDGTILEANQAACDLFGYTQDEFRLIGRNGITVQSEELSLALQRRFVEKESQGELLGVKKNGEHFECEYSSIIFKDDNDEEFTSVMVKDISERKQQEQEKQNLLLQIIEAKSKFEIIINSIEGIFWESKVENFQFTYVSPQVKKILGYDPEEWYNNPVFWQEHVYHEDKDFAVEFCHTKTQLAENHSFEYRMLAADGRIVWLRDIVTVVLDDNKPKWLRGVMIDITERKKIEEENSLKEQRFKKLVQDGGDLIVILDSSGNYTYVSPTSFSILEIEAKEFIGKNAFDFVHPDDKEMVISSFSMLKSEKRVLVKPFRFLHKDKTWRWIETTITNLLDDPAVNGIVANSKDVTEKLKIQEQKDFERRDKAALINNTNDLIWSVSRNLDLIAANDAFIQTIFNNTGIVLKPGDNVMLKDYFPGDFLQFWQSSYDKVLNGQAFNTEVFTPPLNGLPETWANISLKPIYKEDKIVGIACYSRDITELKKIEKEKQLELNINKIFNTEERLENVLPQILREILLFCDKKVAEIWVLNIDSSEFHLMSQETNNIQVVTEEEIKHLKLGEGLPGKVWELKTDILIKDLQTSDVYLRKKFAESNNLVSCIATPIIFKDRVIGVIVIYSDVIIDNKESFIKLNPNIITQLAIDIQRKKTEAELNLFFNLSPDLLCLAGFDGYFKKINSAFEKVLGYSEEYLLSKSFIDIIHPEDKESTLEKLKDLFLGKSVFYFENRYVTVTGDYVWISWTSVPLENENLIIALGKDITERKKQEQQIYEKSKFIVDILESIGDAFFTLDENFIVTYWNNVAEELIQTPREKILGKNLWDIFPDAKTLPSYMNYNIVMEKKITMHFEDYYEPIDKWLEISAYPSETGISVYFKDITERKIANEKLFKLNTQLIQQTRELSVSNAELEQFAYIASHDLQEPLRMITSFLTQLENKYKNQLDDKAHQYINFAVDGAKRMREIILDLLEYSRVGKIDYKAEWINLNELVEEIKHIHFKQIADKKAEIESEILPTIFAPKTPIFQIFTNLIENALKYHKPEVSPIVKIAFKDEKDKWQFSINDNGIGIEQEYFDKIFVIFQRLHTKNEYYGTGMGLAIVKKIIDNLGGEIWVESIPGKQSTFYFTIIKDNYGRSES